MHRHSEAAPRQWIGWHVTHDMRDTSPFPPSRAASRQFPSPVGSKNPLELCAFPTIIPRKTFNGSMLSCANGLPNRRKLASDARPSSSVEDHDEPHPDICRQFILP